MPTQSAVSGRGTVEVHPVDAQAIFVLFTSEDTPRERAALKPEQLARLALGTAQRPESMMHTAALVRLHARALSTRPAHVANARRR